MAGDVHWGMSKAKTKTKSKVKAKAKTKAKVKTAAKTKVKATAKKPSRAAVKNQSIRQKAKNAVKGGPKSVKKDKRVGAGRGQKG